MDKMVKKLNDKGILYGFKGTLELPEIYQKFCILKDGLIQFSLVFIYPEFSQFDFVNQADEGNCIDMHFSHIFGEGLPWDQKQLY